MRREKRKKGVGVSQGREKERDKAEEWGLEEHGNYCGIRGKAKKRS